MPSERLPHIVLTDFFESSSYTSTSSVVLDKTPAYRNRMTHGQYLQRKFDQAWSESEQERVVAHSARDGVYLEFISDPDAELVTKSLEEMRSKQVRLLNIREVKSFIENCNGEKEELVTTYATVYVGDAQKKYFAKKIEDYLTKSSPSGNPCNQLLINSIAEIRKALLVDSFWVDSPGLVPDSDSEWVEVWLSSDSDKVVSTFDVLLAELQIEARKGFIRFPERIVKVIYANHSQLEMLSLYSDHIAEYRRAKSTAAFYMEMDNAEQSSWVAELLGRTSFAESSMSAVCILDTGVNNGHPLIKPVLSDDDCQAVDGAWGTGDHHRHGTLMAGVSAYGDLGKILSADGLVQVSHCLESVKIIPPPPEQNAPNLWGYITSEAVSLAEIQAPHRKRSICMAVAADDTRDRGRPSSWSAMLDQLAASKDAKKLIILCAGNTTANILEAAKQYPDIQLTDSIHDPAQSWNSITIGAYTCLDQLTDPELSGYFPVASKNTLSPYTTTSMTWEENKWPIKPELVLEGGNLAIDDAGFATDCDDLSILSTWHKPFERNFHPFAMTSAAAAQLACMSGQLRAIYPEYWEETVRALLVHSAEWPEALKRQFIEKDSKTAYKRLLSICGYGVPSLERALYSTKNELTLISQAEIQPYDKKINGSGYRTKDMHVYELPWPKQTLIDLPYDTKIQMRVTLSYFIEPGPGEVGWKDRYRYASHALRFELNSPGESREEFEKRINKDARDADEGKPGSKSPTDHWLLGSQARDRGSIHSDIWQGTAQDLATSNLIGITPTIGWWRERSHLGKWNSKTRYSLIVSITTPDETVDVYTPVAIDVGVPIASEIST